jgi:radical SAM-linked protein
VVLAPADPYEVAHARLGLRWLHAAIAELEGVRVERAPLPAADRRAQLMRAGRWLETLESGVPVREAALILVLLDHPLQATHVVHLLDAAGLEPLAEDRGEDDPPVLGLALGAAPEAIWSGLFDAGVPGARLPGLPETLDRWRALGGGRGKTAAVELFSAGDAGPAAAAWPPPGRWLAPHLVPRPREGPERAPWCLEGTDAMAPLTVRAVLEGLTGESVPLPRWLEPTALAGAWVPEPVLARVIDELAARRAGGVAGGVFARRVEEVWAREARLALSGAQPPPWDAEGADHLLRALEVGGRRRLGVDVVVGLPGESDRGLDRVVDAIVALADRWRQREGSRPPFEVDVRAAAAPCGADPPPPWPEEELLGRVDRVREGLPGSLRVKRRPVPRLRGEELLVRAGPASSGALVAAARQLEQLGWAEPELVLRAVEQEMRAQGVDVEARLRGGPTRSSPAAGPCPEPPLPTSTPDPSVRRPGPWATAPEGRPPVRYRLKFARCGPARWLGHLDVMRALELGLLRSGALPEGGGERLKLSSSPALPVGVASRAEYLDVECAHGLDPAWQPRSAAPWLPRGLGVLAAVPLPPRARDIQDVVRRACYRVRLGGIGEREGRRAVEAFLARPEVPITRRRKGRVQAFDVRPLVKELRFSSSRGLELTLSLSPSGSARPLEVIEGVFGACPADPDRMTRTELLAFIGGRWASPLLAARRSRHLVLD